MTRQLSVLTCLILSISVYGQTVKLPPTIEVSVGRLGAVAVEWDGDDFKYDVPPDLDCFREYDPNPKVIRLRVIGYSTGKFRITAVTCKGSKLSDFAYCTVNVTGGPVPPFPPTPPVPPVPPPIPIPKVDKVWVVIVHDLPNLDIPTSFIETDGDFWNSIRPKVHGWRFYDINAAETKAKHYDTLLSKRSVTVPALILMDSTGKPLSVTPLPKSTAGIKQLIDEITK